MIPVYWNQCKIWYWWQLCDHLTSDVVHTCTSTGESFCWTTWTYTFFSVACPETEM